jgi:TolA-binding protein
MYQNVIRHQKPARFLKSKFLFFMTNTNYPSAPDTTENAPNTSGNAGKNLIIGILTAALLGTWGYILWSNNTNTGSSGSGGDTKMEIAMSESDSLRQMFNLAEIRLDSITGANNILHGQNSALQKEIASRKIEINRILNDKNATAEDLKRARQLIEELNGQIGKLESEISQLRGENQELTKQNTNLADEKNVLTQNLVTKTAEKKELENTVDVASTLTATDISITPLRDARNGKEKETTLAKKVDKLKISFFVENRIATSSMVDLYVIVTNPKGQIIQNEILGSGSMTTRQDGDRNFSAKVPVEYETGTRKNVSFSLTNPDGFLHGDYKIEIYHNGFKIGEGIKSLKKGGLFG